jgi:site-specific DNA-methyltransferase (adenine-specific)
MTVSILQGDCREVLKSLPDASVDSIVTDPPYHLTTGKKGGSGPASVNLDSPYGRARVTTGFMGMTWDGGDVAFDVQTWAECLRVLKPGGHLLAFSGTRTYHRMACAIEDAGFEIRDQIGWCYGSGFPKSHNGEWGGTALKPAWEPVCMARKPLIGTVEANWRKHGTGALNIDGCRVGNTRPVMAKVSDGDAREFLRAEGRGVIGMAQEGRWPANLIHDGSDEVVARFPADAPSGGHVSHRVEPKSKNVYGGFGTPKEEVVGYPDSGSAARFFYCAKADREDRGEGNNHPTVKPTDLMRYLCRLVTPPGGTVLDPFAGSGSTLLAADREGFNAIGIELSPEYVEIARRRIYTDAPLFAEVA